MKNSLGILSLILAISCGHPYSQGERLYVEYCASCHMDDGSGLSGVIPPLSGSTTLRNEAHLLPCIIRNGMEGPIVVAGKTYDRPMPGIPELTETETANIINYLQYRWGNPEVFMGPLEVRGILDSCGSEPVRAAPSPTPSG